jgi:DNA-binding GntR family transcriptional regulator
MANPSGLAAHAYERMRGAILRGEIAPGDAVVENRMAELLGMSRTPLREALQMLARDGFLATLPTKGYMVARRSLEDLRELFELRESLEGLATRCTAARATDAEVEELSGICHRYEAATEAADWVKTGTEFHGRILVLSRNARLITFLDSLKAQIVLERQTQLSGVDARRGEAVREHRAIFEAIRARDGDAAEREARSHVRTSYEVTLRGFQAR